MKKLTGNDINYLIYGASLSILIVGLILTSIFGIVMINDFKNQIGNTCNNREYKHWEFESGKVKCFNIVESYRGDYKLVDEYSMYLPFSKLIDFSVQWMILVIIPIMIFLIYTLVKLILKIIY